MIITRATKTGNGKLLVRDVDSGLFVIYGDELQPLPGGDFFADHPIDAFLPLADNSSLVVSHSHGFFRYDDLQFSPLDFPAGDFIKRDRAIHSIRMKNGYSA